MNYSMPDRYRHQQRWGILGTGRMARRMAEAVASVDGATLLAVGSSSMERAEAMALEFGAERPFTCSEGFPSGDELDLLYVATVHARHHDEVQKALALGHHVLCEKPLALNAAQASRMAEHARSSHRFLMEAMWMKCFPAFREILRLLADGAIGQPTAVHADFCFKTPFDRASRLFDPVQGGGALLDLGIYPVTLAQAVFQVYPEGISGTAEIGRTGVDEQDVLCLEYPGGGRANLSCGFRETGESRAMITGTEGHIELPPGFFYPSRFNLVRGGNTEPFTFENPANGYVYEVRHVRDCLLEERTESPWLPLDASIEVLTILDRLRQIWGLCYPGEPEVQR